MVLGAQQTVTYRHIFKGISPILLPLSHIFKLKIMLYQIHFV